MASERNLQADDRAMIRRWAQSAPWWRRMLGRAGLQGKLVAGFLVLLFAALSCSCWLFVSRSQRMLSDVLGEQAMQISQTLALASQGPLDNNDVAELHRVGRDLLKSRNIVLVAFCDAAGKPLASASRDPDFDWQRTSIPRSMGELMKIQRLQSPVLGEYLQVSAPVVRYATVRSDAGHTQIATRLAGYVTVGVSESREQTELRNSSLLALAAGCLIFALCLPLGFWMVRRILLPIRQLVLATRRIASGDYSARVAVDRPDEIGTLARAFNEMSQRVQQQQEQLTEANHDLEEKVRQRTRELESSNARLSSEIAEKEDFLRAVSHDLNAPLRNIGGMAAMLLVKHRQSLDDDIVHRLERIQKNVEVETDLISELLELSRIKTRRQKMEPVDTDALVHDLAGMFDSDLRHAGIRLVADTPLPVLNAEKARIRQVLQNLIDNAIKYMGEGPLREIGIGCRIGGGEAEFHVRDTGLGIDAEDLQKVFGVFRRGRNCAAANVAGKGVGLASVKSIIETYGGRIWVESQVGAGSTFRFTIPSRHLLSAPGETVAA